VIQLVGLHFESKGISRGRQAEFGLHRPLQHPLLWLDEFHLFVPSREAMGHDLA
jgi:hypothetical protein